MSHYITQYCFKHGEWDMDVDNPGPCPDCPVCPTCKGSGVAPSPTETSILDDVMEIKRLSDEVLARPTGDKE